MRMLAQIWTWLRAAMVKYQPAPGPESWAYQAGYRAFDTGETNPHIKGTSYHRAWKHGLADRESEEMSYW